MLLRKCSSWYPWGGPQRRESAEAEAKVCFTSCLHILALHVFIDSPLELAPFPLPLRWLYLPTAVVQWSFFVTLTNYCRCWRVFPLTSPCELTLFCLPLCWLSAVVSWSCFLAKYYGCDVERPSFIGKWKIIQIIKKTNKLQTKNNPKKQNKQNKKQTKNNKHAWFETQRDIVLLPNGRSLLIPLALKVHSLLRCLLPSCDKTPKIQQGLPSQSFKQCAYYPWWGQAISLGGAPAARGTPFFCGTFFLVCFLGVFVCLFFCFLNYLLVSSKMKHFASWYYSINSQQIPNLENHEVNFSDAHAITLFLFQTHRCTSACETFRFSGGKLDRDS